MMTPAVAALRIDRQMKSLETQFDQVLSTHAGLTALLAQARVDVGDPFGNGHVALARMSKSLEALIVSRSDIVRVHGELERIAVERGDIMLTPKPSNGQLVVGDDEEREVVRAA